MSNYDCCDNICSNSEDSNTEQLLLRELPVDGINWSDIAMETVSNFEFWWGALEASAT